jgi:hypothetical protein
VSLFVSAADSGLLMSEQTRTQTHAATSFADAGIRVVAVDLVTGAPLWTVEPVIDSVADDETVRWVHMLPVRDQSSSAGHLYASLLVLTSSGNLYSWNIDPNSGNEYQPTTSAPQSTAYLKSARFSQKLENVGDVRSVVGFTSQSSANPAAAIAVAHGDAEADSSAATTASGMDHLLAHTQYLFVSAPKSHNGDVSVALYPPAKDTSLHGNAKKHSNSSHFIHTVDAEAGQFQTYKVDFSACQVSGQVHSCPGRAIGSLAFPHTSEAIVSVVYPSAFDQIDKRFSVLGDDSVLLKYINHHTVLIASVSPPQARDDPKICEQAASSSQGQDGSDPDGQSAPSLECKLHVTLVDTISAKVIYRLQHEHGTGPVHSTLIENNIVYSYWNSKVRIFLLCARCLDDFLCCSG